MYTIDGVKSPHDVAVAPDGSILVAEEQRNKIMTFDHKGAFLGWHTLPHPSVLAAGASGELYIGRGKYSTDSPPYNRPGEVKVYDSRFTHLYSLGEGEGEFINPTDIFIDQDGRVYVTDGDADTVKVFNQDGTPALSFGAYGTGDGYFNMPLSVAVDEATGDIYVSDKQMVENSSGGSVAGARIQVYSATGTFIRGFGSYSLGELISPSDIALYNGKLYVADSYQNVVQVYDAASGQYQYVIQVPDGLLRMAVSLDISPDGLLYVVSGRTDRVYVFGVDNYVDFRITPLQLNFEAIAGGASPPDQDVTIMSSGAADLNWTARTGEDWIQIRTTSGITAPGQQMTVGIAIDHGTLEPGEYAGNITITSAGGTEEVIKVQLIVTEPPILEVYPDTLIFTADAGGSDPPALAIQIMLTNAPEGITWQANSSDTWLGVNPVEAGTGTTDGIVNITSGGLNAGEYSGTITVTCAGANGSPATIAVALTVKQSGAITVLTNHADAGFSITGDNGIFYDGRGTDWRVSGVPDGTYTIAYQQLQGYRTPAEDTQTLSNGQEIVFVGQYHLLENIIATQGRSVTKTDEWGSSQTIRIYSGGGRLLGEFPVFEGYASGLDTVVGDIDGDGLKEIIAGLLGYSHIRVYDEAGTELARLQAFASERGGVQLAAADFNGDGDDELVVMSLRDGAVKLYDYDPVSRRLVETSIHFMAYGGQRASGYMIGAGDVDGDRETELVSLMNMNWSAPVLKVWEIVPGDTPGGWTAGIEAEAVLGFNGINALEVADRDGDGGADILIATGSTVVEVDTAGTITETLLTGLWRVKDMAAGDVDGDGVKEVVIGQNRTGKVLVYDEGIQTGNFQTFDRVPVMVSTGAVRPRSSLTGNASSGSTSVSSVSFSDGRDDEHERPDDEGQVRAGRGAEEPVSPLLSGSSMNLNSSSEQRDEDDEEEGHEERNRDSD